MSPDDSSDQDVGTLITVSKLTPPTTSSVSAVSVASLRLLPPNARPPMVLETAGVAIVTRLKATATGSETAMSANNLLTAAIFSAFLKCPTKAHLLMSGASNPETSFADIEARISSMYKATAQRHLGIEAEFAQILDFGQLDHSLNHAGVPRYVDCKTATYDLAQPPFKPGGHRSQSSSHSKNVLLPILFLPWDKPEVSDNLLVCFGALALSQATGLLADTGMLIYGDGYRHKTVRIGEYVVRTRQIVNAICACCGSQESPYLALNRHCAICDFQPRCRGLAIERDDLSLLTAMTVKERAKCNAKGVSTITQLSYGYRPRRRKHTKRGGDRSSKSDERANKVVKNDHKLKALAIKKSQIHVVGTASLRFEGTAVFLDVEGMPDRGFYYLIGLQYELAGEQVEQSLWADAPRDEREIWESCLRTLKAVGNVQVVSYGAYENRFLKQMKARYVRSPDDAEFVDRLIETSVNLVGCIYGKIYFPTFSNSLKEVGRYLGCEWAWTTASGAATPLLRRAWELGADDELKFMLIRYNRDDCRAASIVADALVRICDGGARKLDAIDVASLEVESQRTFGRFVSVLPEFEKINSAAYWDYQRDKVFVRSNPALRKAINRRRRNDRRILPTNATIRSSRPRNCPSCNSTAVFRNGRYHRVIIDIKFFNGGMRRWLVKYIVDQYKCGDCGLPFSSDVRNFGRSPYGPNVLSYVIYNVVELYVPQNKLSHIVQKFFNFTLDQPTISRMILKAADKYRDTYEEIRQRLSNGRLIHADETHVSVQGKDSYVWVFTSMEDVVYIWSETREGSVVRDFLNEFNGILVSDFYPAYDSIDSQQQRCLIHLIRDLNDNIFSEPFNIEIKQIGQDFAALLKPVIDTIDRFGLKTHFLRKHKPAVGRFFDTLLSRKYHTSLAQKTQERFKRNRSRLFTFLDYDNVPWNNNNAEHAVKSFARLRDVIDGTTTERGIRDYLILLSICQTCRYREIDFFGFLRSGAKKIENP
jgi:predicted RecB family nuclease